MNDTTQPTGGRSRTKVVPVAARPDARPPAAAQPATVQPAAAHPAAARPAAPRVESAFAAAACEIPGVFRELAEQGLSQARAGYDRMMAAAEDATSIMEGAYTSATKGAADCGLKLIEAARTNANTAFDHAADLLGARSLSEVIELSTAHARRQLAAAAAQSRELAGLAQKMALEAAAPIKDSLSRAAGKAA